MTFKQTTYYEMYGSEFSGLINREFGTFHYNFYEDMEVDNDSAHTFLVKKTTEDIWFDSHYVFKFENFLEGKNTYHIAHLLLQILVNQDRLPEGNYLIWVSW